jgi:hypothetical protein
MNRVFIPQVPQHFDDALQKMVTRFNTLDQAAEFGELVILLDRNDDVWNPDAVLAKLERAMRSFTDDDYILPMGSYPFMMWTAMIAMSKARNYVQHLQWHQREKNYRVITTKVTRYKQ